MFSMVDSTSFRNKFVHAKPTELLARIPEKNLSCPIRERDLTGSVYLQNSVRSIFDQFPEASIGQTCCASLRLLLGQESNLLVAREKPSFHRHPCRDISCDLGHSYESAS